MPFFSKVENLKKVIKASSQSELDNSVVSGITAAYHSQQYQQKAPATSKTKGSVYLTSQHTISNLLFWSPYVDDFTTSVLVPIVSRNVYVRGPELDCNSICWKNLGFEDAFDRLLVTIIDQILELSDIFGALNYFHHCSVFNFSLQYQSPF